MPSPEIKRGNGKSSVNKYLKPPIIQIFSLVSSPSLESFQTSAFSTGEGIVSVSTICSVTVGSTQLNKPSHILHHITSYYIILPCLMGGKETSHPQNCVPFMAPGKFTPTSPWFLDSPSLSPKDEVLQGSNGQ